MKKNIFILCIISLPVVCYCQNFKNRNILGEENARIAVKNALSESSGKSFNDTLIKDKETAIDIAEPILMNLYGKATVADEKPYECYLIDGYWFLRGTLPRNHTGEVFEMIMSAKDARIIKMTHGK